MRRFLDIKPYLCGPVTQATWADTKVIDLGLGKKCGDCFTPGCDRCQQVVRKCAGEFSINTLDELFRGDQEVAERLDYGSMWVPLHKAIVDGDETRVKSLVGNPGSLGMVSNGVKPLELAVLLGNYAVSKLLIDKAIAFGCCKKVLANQNTVGNPPFIEGVYAGKGYLLLKLILYLDYMNMNSNDVENSPIGWALAAEDIEGRSLLHVSICERLNEVTRAILRTKWIDRLAVGRFDIPRTPDGKSPFYKDEECGDQIFGLPAVDALHPRFEQIIGLGEAKERLIDEFKYFMGEGRKSGSGKIGALLTGQPGTGKTLLGRALAREVGAGFIEADIAKIGGIYINSNARDIGRIYDLAEKLAEREGSVILFLDEINKIIPTRRTDRVGQSEEKRDGVDTFLQRSSQAGTKGVFTVGATNIRTAIDAAAIRRLEIIPIGVPDEGERVRHLRSHLNRAPFSGIGRKELRKLARVTRGFSPSFLCDIVGGATRVAKKKGERLSTSHLSSAYEKSFDVLFPPENLLGKRESVRNIFQAPIVQEPDLSDLELQVIQEHYVKSIIRFFRDPERKLCASEGNVNKLARRLLMPRHMLLYGPPGTGKTTIARKISELEPCTFYRVSGDEIYSAEAEGVSKVFADARRLAPCVLFIDEIDSLVSGHNLVVNVFKQELDGFEEQDPGKPVILIGATNDLGRINSAIRDRCVKVEVGLPGVSRRRKALEKLLLSFPWELDETVETDDCLTHLVSRTAGLSFRDIEQAITLAWGLSISESGKRRVTRGTIDTALTVILSDLASQAATSLVQNHGAVLAGTSHVAGMPTFMTMGTTGHTMSAAQQGVHTSSSSTSSNVTGAPIPSQSSSLPALFTAILENDIRSVVHLLRAGLDPTVADEMGLTPLHYAVSRDSMSIVTLLLNKLSDVDPIDFEGCTPLHIAIRNGTWEIVKQLVRRGADVDIPSPRGTVPAQVPFISNLSLSSSLAIGMKSNDYSVADENKN